MPAVTRRAFLAGPAIGAAAALVAPAEAATPPAKMQGPGVYRYRLGSYQLTALYDGTWFLPIERDFVRNAERAEVNAALGRAFLPPNVLPVSFTALLVNTGKKLVLIDTGTAGQVADTAGVMLDNLKAAGIKPADVDTILISHFHPDHIDGIKIERQRQGLPQRRDPGAGGRMGVLDGRRQHGARRRQEPRAPLFPQRPAHLRRHRQGGAPLQARRRGRARHRSRSPLTATRPATPPSPFIPARNRCWR